MIADSPLIKTIIKITLLSLMQINRLNIKSRGAIFCHVANNMQDLHGNPDITEGTHKWNGKTPNFNIKPIMIIKIVIYS